jgi:hypothetical protein
MWSAMFSFNDGGRSWGPLCLHYILIVILSLPFLSLFTYFAFHCSFSHRFYIFLKSIIQISLPRDQDNTNDNDLYW